MKVKTFTALFLFLMILSTRTLLHAQCTSVTKTASNAASQTFNNGGADKSSFGFSTPDSALTSDGKCTTASAIIAILSGNTEYLKLTNFNFSIPSTATICGVEVTVRKKAAFVNVLSTVSDYAVYLVRNGIVTGTNKRIAGNWTTTAADFVYGSNADKWGATLTPADVNASNFGIAFSAAISGTISLIPSAKIDFMQVTVYYQPGTLPVKLSEFKAVAGDNNVNLFWKSEEEINFSHYEVERSLDGVNFEKIATLSPLPASKNYSYTDHNPALRNYYRLKMVDLDYTFTYSGIVSAGLDAASAQLRVAPNPVTNICTINLPGYKNGSYRIEVRNSSGQLLNAKEITLYNGSSMQLSFSNYAKGLYLVKIYSTHNDLVHTIKILH